MKIIKENMFFYISLFFIFLLSVYAGLADYDYYWQADLGKAIVNNGDFHHATNQLWGSIGVYEYYDHEWLTNVIFYLFSCFGMKGAFWLKFLISSVVGFIVCLFVSELEERKSLNVIKRFQVLFVSSLISLIFIKIKAYSVSLCFLMVELIILFHYFADIHCSNVADTLALKKRHKNMWTYTLFMVILTILWTNMHSGSMPLLFVVAGLFWLVKVRNKHMLATGVICAITTLINPYGIKLILFNFSHNFDSTMKEILLDWQPIDAKTTLGVICYVIIFLLIINLVSVKRKDWFIILLSCAILYLSFTSARHLLYLFPLVLIVIADGTLLSKVSERFECEFRYFSLFIISLFFLVSFSTYTNKDFNRDYMMIYHDEELFTLVKQYGYEGLYNMDFPYSGFPMFETGAYPMCSDRVKDSFIISNRGSDLNRKDLINYYGLNKFLFVKWNIDISYYQLTNGLYDYLSTNDDYIKLYDSDWYCYFVRKDILNETE